MVAPMKSSAFFARSWIIAVAAAGLLMLVPRSSFAWQSAEAPAPSSASASTHPNLAGTWTLNKDQSDDPRQKMQQAMGNSGGNGPGGGGEGGGGFQGRRGGGQGGPGGSGVGMMQEFNQLTVTQTGDSVKITGASGRLLAQTADNASSGSQSANPSGGSDEAPRFAPPVAQWQGSQLVAVQQSRRGKSTRTYELSSGGSQLIVTTKIENERFQNPVVFRQVYDPAKPASQAPAQ